MIQVVDDFFLLAQQELQPCLQTLHVTLCLLLRGQHFVDRLCQFVLHELVALFHRNEIFGPNLVEQRVSPVVEEDHKVFPGQTCLDLVVDMRVSACFLDHIPPQRQCFAQRHCDPTFHDVLADVSQADPHVRLMVPQVLHESTAFDVLQSDQLHCSLRLSLLCQGFLSPHLSNDTSDLSCVSHHNMSRHLPQEIFVFFPQSPLPEEYNLSVRKPLVQTSVHHSSSPSHLVRVLQKNPHGVLERSP
mmetsp:Transcript_2543/g.6104  ORF Transcript_2543/g.6104 Transcript_2543/m.6104 type:complete len:245 (+) Transcript_2543:630-1364(+)